MSEKRLTVPNLLTSFRFVAAPILLWLAWQGEPYLYLGLLAVSFFSDALDGLIARLTNQTSAFGARLDSYADIVIYSTIVVSVWWLWPAIVERELLWIFTMIVSFLLPMFAALIKFGGMPSYHTWSVKGAAVITGISFYILFLGGPAWPFHLAVIVCLVAAVEEIAITIYLEQPRSDVRSLYSLMRHHRNTRSTR